MYILFPQTRTNQDMPTWTCASAFVDLSVQAPGRNRQILSKISPSRSLKCHPAAPPDPQNMLVFHEGVVSQCAHTPASLNLNLKRHFVSQILHITMLESSCKLSVGAVRAFPSVICGFCPRYQYGSFWPERRSAEED